MPNANRPNFLGIGAQKAGTTWLYFALAHHPEVFMPDCKEVHFWDKQLGKGYDWYEGLFTPAKGKTTGEITPAYAILPPQTIKELSGHYPDLKLIYMVRDPIARAWSGALMGLKKAELAFEEASDQWFLDHFQSSGSLQRGDYRTCLQHWLDYFPKERFLLLDYAAIKTDPRGMLQATATHLGIDASFFAKLDEKHLLATRNEGTGHAIRPSLLPALQEIYQGRMDEFASFAAQHGLVFFR